MLMLFFNISGGEVIFILLMALLLFGAKGFPNVARQMGKGIQQVRKASGELQKDIRESADKVREEVDAAAPREDNSRKEKKGEERSDGSS